MKFFFLLTVLALPVFSVSPIGCDKGKEAFSTTLHPMLRTQCTGCHDTGGMAPPHSVADVGQSYQSLLPLIDFTAPEHSVFVDMVKVQHWKQYPAGTGVQFSEAEAIAALQGWWEKGQNECPQVVSTFTNPLKIPMNLAFDKFTKISLAFPKEVAFLQEGHLDLEIKALGTARTRKVTGYLVRRPKLITPKTSVRVESVHFSLNGLHLADANNFLPIRANVNTTTVESPVLSSNTVILRKKTDGEDTLTVGFEKLEATQEVHCRYPQDFEKATLTVFEKRACHYCHGGGKDKYQGNEAKAVFNMDLTVAALCDSALQRATTDNPAQDPFISLPLRGSLDHPRAIIYGTEVLPSWSDWITKEKTP